MNNISESYLTWLDFQAPRFASYFSSEYSRQGERLLQNTEEDFLVSLDQFTDVSLAYSMWQGPQSGMLFNSGDIKLEKS